MGEEVHIEYFLDWGRLFGLFETFSFLVGMGCGVMVMALAGAITAHRRAKRLGAQRRRLARLGLR